MIFEDNYMEYIEDFTELVNRRGLIDGFQIQCNCLYDTDEDSLTERERFIMILAVAKIEIELGVLTNEIKKEIELYYKEWCEGKFDGLLGDDEIEIMRKDLFECYNKVFK